MAIEIYLHQFYRVKLVKFRIMAIMRFISIVSYKYFKQDQICKIPQVYNICVVFVILKWKFVDIHIRWGRIR